MCDSPGVNVEALADQHYESVLRFLRRLTSSIADAEDLTQTTFMAVLDRAQSGRSIENPRAYLMQTAYHAYCSWRTAQTTAARHFERYEGPVAGGGACPHRTASDRELVRRVRLAFEELPANHRAALALIVLEGMSYDRAAEILGTSRGMVTLWRWRGLVGLRKKLADDADLTEGSSSAGIPTETLQPQE